MILYHSKYSQTSPRLQQLEPQVYSLLLIILGNVFTSDTVEELNRRPKHWVDLLTGEQFTYKDIITIQDPNNIQQRTVKDFDFLRNNLKFDPANKEECTYIYIYNNSQPNKLVHEPL